MISVVIPVFNEEENVQPLYQSLKETLTQIGDSYEIIFVDDGSSDNTLNYLKSIQTNANGESNLRILELERNCGQTPALLAGLHNVRGDIIVTLDGDLQNDPKDIPRLVSELNGNCDVVCGWRKNRHDNLLKKIPSKINNFLNQRLNNVSIHDSGCTLRAYKKEAIDGIHLYAEGHRYIPAILANKGFKLTEVETNHHPRTKGKTKYGLARIPRGFIDLFTLRTLNKWAAKPIHFFVKWFIFLTLLGGISTIWIILERFLFYRVWNYYPEPIFMLRNPLLIVSILFFLFGLFSLLIGFLAEIVVRKTTDSRDSYKIKREWV